MPILGLLGVMFIGLKLAHVIFWSWWWVLAPFWVPPLLMCAGSLGALIGSVCGLLVMGFVQRRDRKRRLARRQAASKIENRLV